LKTINSTALTALTEGTAIVAASAAIYTSSPAFVWSGYGDLVIGSDTYTGIGDAGTVSPVNMEAGGLESGLQLALANFDPYVNTLIAAEDLRGKPAVLRRLIFDSHGTTLLDSNVFFRGRVDQVNLKEMIGGNADAVISVEGSARGLNRNGNRIANLDDQITVSATDTSFERIATSPTVILYWMGKEPVRASQSVNGGLLGSIWGRVTDGVIEKGRFGIFGQ
jgi:hypothetical protein